jgi:hypothetical protein
MEEARTEGVTEKGEIPKKKKKEGDLSGQQYFIIQFPAARKEVGEPPRVPVNTPNYKAPQGMARNTPLPVPAEVIEAFDHAQYTNWQNVEGEKRKVGERRHRFPYSRICEISEEGYNILRAMARERDITEKDYLPYKI